MIVYLKLFSCQFDGTQNFQSRHLSLSFDLGVRACVRASVYMSTLLKMFSKIDLINAQRTHTHTHMSLSFDRDQTILVIGYMEQY